MSRASLVLGLAGSLTAVAVVRRARGLAIAQGRSPAAALAALPRQLARDLATVPDDARAALAEARIAAARRRAEVDAEVERLAGGSRDAS